MTVLQPMLDSPQIQRLGWTLLHSLWEGTAVALALMLVLRLMRKTAAGTRYVVSCAAMLAALASPVFTFLALQPAPSASQYVSTTAQTSIPAISSPAVAPTGNQPAQSLTPPAQPLIVRSTNRSVPQAGPARFMVPSRSLSSRALGMLRPAIPWLVPVWVLGVALLSLRNLGGWVAIQRLKVVSTVAVDPEIRDMADRLRCRLKLRRAVQLLASAKAVSPMVVGVLKPVILVPASALCELSAAQLESILAHELAHVRRHDYLANLLQSVIETLMFYHPAVWWIGRQIRIERENCCDDIAIALTRDRVAYVRALALVAGGVPALAPAAAAGSLVSRVRRILGLPNRDPVSASRWLSGAVLAAVLSCLLVFWSRVPAAHAATTPSPQPGTLSGTVVDTQGRPLAGAKVMFESYDNAMGSPIPARDAVTDATGRFRLGPIAPDYRHPWDLQIEAPGVGFQYVPGTTYSIYAGTDYDLGAIQVEQGRVFSGQVLDFDGKPVSGASVQYYVQRLIQGHTVIDILPRRKLSTDAQGRFKTPPLPVGLLNLDVYAPDRQRAGWGWDSIVPGGQQELMPVRLKKDVPIVGTVRDEQGRPLSGAVIAANDYPVAHSNAAGQYILRGFRPNPDFQVQVSKPGYVFINRAAEQKPDGWRYEDVESKDWRWIGPAPQLDFVMKREGAITGRAIDAETGQPIRLQRIVSCSFERQPDGHILLSSCFGTDFQQPNPGEFRISYDTPIEYHLTFSAEGYDDAEAFTPKIRELQPIEGLVVKLKRQAGAEKALIRSQQIRGTVTRDGKPLKTGWVGLWRIRDTQNVMNSPMMRGRTVERARMVLGSAPIENGVYTLNVPNPGDDWYVVAEEPGRALTQVGPIAVAPEERKTLDIRCIDGGTISGHVDGIPAAWAGNIWVLAFNRTGVRAEARVYPNGNFSLTNLPPGEYGLKAGYDGFHDSEVPEKGAPEDWKNPAQPWRRAIVVKVAPARETAEVRLALPAN